MQCRFKLRNYPITKLQNSQRGYILITLMLFLALIAIAALAVLPDVVQQARRDREEEMINRAVQYSRAIRRYYKKFGRYPTRIEELENTNQIRFLRKRYKDPITGKDFKILRMGDPILAAQGFTGGVGIGVGVGQNPGQGFVAAPGGGIRAAGPGDANMPQVTGLPQQVNTGGGNPSSDDSGDNQAVSPGTSRTTGSSGPGSAAGPSGSSGTTKSPFSGQTFGGGPMLGVVSTSKATSIREFNKKNHYNEWLFIYDPTSDRGGLLTTPYQQNLNLNATTGQPGGTSGQPQSNFGPQNPPQAQPGGPPNPANEMPPDQ